MVPLRLEAPLAPSSSRLGDDRVGPQPTMLRFLLDDTTGAAGVDDSVSAMPRLEPVLDSGVMAVAVGVNTNVYRLGSLLDEVTPSRPLPVQGLDDVAELETRLRKRADKVMSLKKLDGLGVSLRSFSINDTALDDITVEGDSESDSGRSSHAAAALALPALSDEGSFDSVDDIDLAAAGLDELARQLGLEGLVPRAASPMRADDSLDGFGDLDVDDGEYHEVDADDVDDVELVAVTTPANPMRAIVIARPVVPNDDVDALEGDDDHDAELAADFEDAGISLASAAMRPAHNRSSPCASGFNRERNTVTIIFSSRLVSVWCLGATRGRPGYHEAFSGRAAKTDRHTVWKRWTASAGSTWAGS